MFSGPLLRVCGSQGVSYIQCLEGQSSRLQLCLQYCGKCLGSLGACRLQTQQGGFVARHEKGAASRGGKGFPGTWLGLSGLQLPHVPAFAFHHHHCLHLLMAVSFPKCSTPIESFVCGRAGCNWSKREISPCYMAKLALT